MSVKLKTNDIRKRTDLTNSLPGILSRQITLSLQISPSGVVILRDNAQARSDNRVQETIDTQTNVAMSTLEISSHVRSVLASIHCLQTSNHTKNASQIKPNSTFSVQRRHSATTASCQSAFSPTPTKSSFSTTPMRTLKTNSKSSGALLASFGVKKKHAIPRKTSQAVADFMICAQHMTVP